ncbi:hypothetical protein DFP73DRAFT_55317 [Morchella snyderi]|nr:hypothetical protein DFP73DRAFT_55317 [Morchella snyderi]
MLFYVCLGFSVNFHANILSSHIPLIFYSPRLSFLLSLQGITHTSHLIFVSYLIFALVLLSGVFCFSLLGSDISLLFPVLFFVINYPTYSFFSFFFLYSRRKQNILARAFRCGTYITRTSDSDQTWSYFSFVIGRAVYQRIRGLLGYYISIVVRNFFIHFLCRRGVLE